MARDCAPILVRTARAAGLSEDDAWDATQDTMLVFVRRADQFDGRASVRAWLLGILFKKIAERRRALGRDEPVDDIDAVMATRFDALGRWARPPRPTDAALGASEIRALVAECLEHLAERSRHAFVLREVQELETSEICKILGVSPNNLGVLLYRARNRLRECLEAWGIRGSRDAAV